MPRIRTVKPEFWRSPDVIELNDFQQLLYIGLWNFTDDEGRGAYDPTAIAADVFLRKYALDPRGVTEDIETAFQAYAERDMVTVYRVNGRDYYQINNWHDHQKINRPQKSKIPPLDQAEQIIHGAFTEHSVNDHGGISEGSRKDHGAFTDRSLREGKGKPFTERSLLTESSDTGEQTPAQSEPVADSLNELAARHFAKEKYPGAYGTPDDPRCAQHVHLAHENVPNCHKCADARRIFQEHAQDAKDQAKAERRAAIDACDLCDENGFREIPGGVAKCDHVAEDVPPWEVAQ